MNAELKKQLTSAAILVVVLAIAIPVGLQLNTKVTEWMKKG